MTNKTKQLDRIILGSCSFFVCRCCRTKYGWEHQTWCDSVELTEPGCKDCVYYNQKREQCSHPAKKLKWRDAG